MTVTIMMPLPKQQFLSNLGTPLVGGKVYTYAAGTTDPKSTWTDAAGTIAQPWPIPLNVRGEPASPIFWSGNYKVEVRDALNNVIYTVDNFNTDPAGVWQLEAELAQQDGASKIGYTAPGAGAQPQTVEDSLNQFGSVFNYMTEAQKADVLSGAPVLDHTAAVQAAIAECKNLYWGSADHKYRITSKLNFNIAGQQHYGAGTLLFAGDATTRLADVTANNVFFYGVTFDGNMRQPLSGLVYVKSGVNRPRFHRCTIRNIRGTQYGSSQLNQMYGLLVSPYAVTDFEVVDCLFQDILKHNDGTYIAPAVGLGFVGGICFLEDTMAVPAAAQPTPSRGMIRGCVFDNIQTLLAGGLSLGNQADYNDADAIRTYCQPGGAEALLVHVSDCVFRNVSKRAFKFRATGSSIQNCAIYTDGLQYGMILPVDIQSNVQVKNVAVHASAAKPVQAGLQWSVPAGVFNREAIVEGFYVSHAITGANIFADSAQTPLMNFVLRNATFNQCSAYGFAISSPFPTDMDSIKLENVEITGMGNTCAGLQCAPATNGKSGVRLSNVKVRNASIRVQGYESSIKEVELLIDSATFTGQTTAERLFTIDGGNGSIEIDDLFINAGGLAATFANATRNPMGIIISDGGNYSNVRIRVPDILDSTWPHCEFWGSNWTLDGYKYNGLGWTSIATTVAGTRWAVRNAFRRNLDHPADVTGQPFFYVNNGGTGKALFENITDMCIATGNTITINGAIGPATFVVNNVSTCTSGVPVQHGGLAAETNTRVFA